MNSSMLTKNDQQLYRRLVLEGRPLSFRGFLSLLLQEGYRADRYGKKTSKKATQEVADSLERLLGEGWLRGHGVEDHEPTFVVDGNRVFEFDKMYPDPGVWDKSYREIELCYPLSYGHFAVDEDQIRTTVLAALLEKRDGQAAKKILKWQAVGTDFRAKVIGPELANYFGISIPAKAWQERFPPELKPSYLAALLIQANLELMMLPSFWVEQIKQSSDRRVKAQWDYACAFLEQSRQEQKPTKKTASKAKQLSRFRTLFWAGDYLEAYRVGSEVIAANRRLKYPQLRGIDGLDMLLCSIAVSGDMPEALSRAESWAEHADRASAVAPDLHWLVGMIIAFVVRGDGMDTKTWTSACSVRMESIPILSPRFALLWGLSMAWTGWQPPTDSGERKEILRYFQRILSSENLSLRVRRELNGVLAWLNQESFDEPCLAAAFKTRSKWERYLDRLQEATTSLQEPQQPAENDEFAPHISWEVQTADPQKASWVSIEARYVGTAKSRRGKTASLSTLQERYGSILSETDQRVLSHMRLDAHRGFYGGSATATLDALALLELVGHRYVQDKDGQPLQIEEGQIELRVEKKEAGIVVAVEPKSIVEDKSLIWSYAGPGHLVVYHKAPVLSAALDLFGKGGVAIPPEGAERLTPILQNMAKHCRVVTDGVQIEGQDKVESRSEVCFALTWSGTALRIEAQVMPLGVDEIRFFPGQGDLFVTHSLDGRLCTAMRDLEAEVQALKDVMQHCPRLGALAQSDFDDAQAAKIGELDDALEVMMELSEAEIPVLWESEQTLNAPKHSDESRFRIRIRSARDWVQTEVEFGVDAEKVLGFRELLDARIGDSRFIRLGKDEVIALSESMRRRLDGLSGMGEVDDEGLRTSTQSLAVLDALTSDFGNLEFDKEAKAKIEGLRRAFASKPRVPKSLKAMLRPYQQEGFVWMSRLAKAQLGACLADDMGLGKTIQTLALLCHRGKLGAALVVGPASVVRNWIEEAQRFAPKLSFFDLADSRNEESLQAIGPGDVVVTSYGIMTREIEALEQLEFATVVFDEAHALKNYGTRRCQAARRLNASFRLGLTGTPVENHLGELWSLFQVIIPGLLGSKKEFESRYASSYGGIDPRHLEALRARLGPFLLRRTKTQVLRDLPDLHESVLKVVPSATERAFYRALQEKALEACSAAEGGLANDSRLQILAEITRLRQAAVDPRLVDEVLGPEGEKIQLLMRKLLDLREEGHRALVFTQFLGSLALVKDALETEGISYFELTGATPAKTRAKLIASFQAGEGDVFLISLRAGGTGINLTGADFVFHLDPWWNPAVEDQATARAHRMGQTRPVQVYRLVSSGTIEEKILAMHHDKREMAQDLLGNLDRAKKLSVAELRSLLSG